MCLIGREIRLTPLLKDKHHDVRANAAWALGELGDLRVINELTGLTNDEKPDVQKEAKVALEKLQKKNPS